MTAEEWAEHRLIPVLCDIEGLSEIGAVLGAGEAWDVTMLDGSTFRVTVEER